MIRKTGITGIIISFFLIGCSTLSRNAGFDKPENKKTLFSDMAVPYYEHPDTYVAGPIKINHEESISVSVRGTNRAQAEYLSGYILPFFPIFLFWWTEPQYKPKIHKDEDLKIICSIAFNPGMKYREPVEGKPNADRITQSGYKYLKEREREKKDICTGITIKLTDGKILTAKSSDNDIDVFTFDVKALSVESFEFEVPQVQLADGKYIKVDLRGKFKAFNLIQYKL